MSNKYFVVVGYNNVRIYDVEKLRKKCAELFNARLVLITENPLPQDYKAADIVWACSLAAANARRSLDLIANLIAAARYDILGVLPFSDRGVLLGALLAHRFGLPGGDPETAQAGLDKLVFRNLDTAARQYPENYKPLACRQVKSREDLRGVVDRLQGKAFLKPAKEGNSRGCTVILDRDECDAAWDSLAKYHSDGIIVEELVETAREYSWDYVAGSTWLTEKKVTETRYRAEIQQIVPAPLSARRQAILDAAGQHMRALVSTTHGAFHNEIFLLPGDRVAAVETNMRPAGMHIWDLAALSFQDFDPWTAWIRWAATGECKSRALRHDYHVGIRLIKAPRTGRLLELPDVHRLAAQLGIHPVSWKFNRGVGDTVSPRITDNASFIGQVILKHSSYTELDRQLSALASAIEGAIVVTSPGAMAAQRNPAWTNQPLGMAP